MSLFDALSKISEQIQKQHHLMRHHEDATILVSIQPFIRALGYDTQNLAEVFPQFNADAKTHGGERVDYAIMRDGKPIMFIEAKGVSVSLNESFWKQLYNYFNAADVRFGVLTNGIEYRFYTDLKKSHIMDKQPFLTIDMLNLDERLVAELDSFTKTRFDPQRIIDGARKRVVARLLKQEMDNPSDEIARHFAKQMTTKRVSSSELTHFAGLLREAWQELAKSPKPPPPPNGDCEENGDPEFVPVYGYHEGHQLKAELLRKSIRDGLTIGGHQIRFDGKTTWPKNAAVLAIRSVDPKFEPTKKHPNGFKFWHVVDPADNKEHMIRSISGWDNISDEALRQRVLGKS